MKTSEGTGMDIVEEFQQKIREFLANPDEAPAAKAVLKWQWRLYGDFYTALWEAIKRADDENLGRLAQGFPVEVKGFLEWNRGNLADELRKKGVMD